MADENSAQLRACFLSIYKYNGLLLVYIGYVVALNEICLITDVDLDRVRCVLARRLRLLIEYCLRRAVFSLSMTGCHAYAGRPSDY